MRFRSRTMSSSEALLSKSISLSYTPGLRNKSSLPPDTRGHTIPLSSSGAPFRFRMVNLWLL